MTDQPEDRKKLVLTTAFAASANMRLIRALAMLAAAQGLDVVIGNETIASKDLKPQPLPFPDTIRACITDPAADQDWKKARQKQWRANLTRHNHR